MRLILRRCRICLSWHKPGHYNHCPHCGAIPVGPKFYAFAQDGSAIRQLVSGNSMSLALRNNYYSK